MEPHVVRYFVRIVTYEAMKQNVHIVSALKQTVRDMQRFSFRSLPGQTRSNDSDVTPTRRPRVLHPSGSDRDATANALEHTISNHQITPEENTP